MYGGEGLLELGGQQTSEVSNRLRSSVGDPFYPRSQSSPEGGQSLLTPINGTNLNLHSVYLCIKVSKKDKVRIYLGICYVPGTL